MNTTLKKEKPILWLKTNSPIQPKKNSLQFISVSNNPEKLFQQIPPILTNPSLETLTGSPKVWFKPSKIKDNVDPVGLSPLLLQPNLLPVSAPEPLEISLNKNSFHVVLFPILHAHVWDVMEDKWTKDSDITKNTESVLNNLIHTLLNLISQAVPLKHALNPLSKSTDILMFLLDLHLDSKLLVTNNQYQLPLMPKTGLHIPVESSPTVELLSITESYLPDIHPAIG
jgi:hypothetical protein